MPATEAILSIFALVWGAIWGSFLTVVIHRVPRHESILTPPSHCPHCGSPIRWYQNIPIISYLLLRGRCACCRAPISIRYPIVELTCAMLSLATWHTAAYNPLVPTLTTALVVFIFLFAFVMALVTITFIDLEHMIIPDVITLPAIAVGVLFNVLLGPLVMVSWVESLVGAVSGAGVIALVNLGYYAVTRRTGMGWGDSKLLAMVGAFLGWKSLMFVLLAASVQGLLYAAITLAAGSLPRDAQGGIRKVKIPFGPFLALAAMEWLYFCGWIQRGFFELFRM